MQHLLQPYWDPALFQLQAMEGYEKGFQRHFHIIPHSFVTCKAVHKCNLKRASNESHEKSMSQSFRKTLSSEGFYMPLSVMQHRCLDSLIPHDLSMISNEL